MALLRLITPALIALAVAALAPGCRRTEAAPAAPPGWKTAPSLARAASDAAKTKTVAVTASEAWSEPAMGCYAISLGLDGAATPIDNAADQIVASVQQAGVAVRDVAKPAAGDRGVLVFGFDKPPYHGTLRAELTSLGQISALACLWNQREPKLCAAACTKLLGAAR